MVLVLTQFQKKKSFIKKFKKILTFSVSGLGLEPQSLGLGLETQSLGLDTQSLGLGLCCLNTRRECREKKGRSTVKILLRASEASERQIFGGGGAHFSVLTQGHPKVITQPC